MITFHHGSNTIQQSVKNYFFLVQFIRTPREHYFLNFFINIPFCSQIETNNRCFTYVSKEGILQLSTLANTIFLVFILDTFGRLCLPMTFDDCQSSELSDRCLHEIKNQRDSLKM